MDNIATEQKALEHVVSDASAEPIKLSYSLLRSVTDNFSTEIGRGGFGVVFLGYLGNGKIAVKKLSNAHDFSDKLFLDEIKCLIRAKHKNIVRFLGYCSDTQGEIAKFDGSYVLAEVQERLLCFEYVPNGKIQHYLREKTSQDDWPQRYRMIYGICHGLLYLHEERIGHLDLKPENVMLDSNMEAKITDFGLSRWLDVGKSIIVTANIRGTMGYIAPETMTRGELSFRSDIYALGIILIKLLIGQNNIDFENWHESLDGDCPQIRSCINIARACVEIDQSKRPTIGEIIDRLNDMGNPESSMNQARSCAFPWTELLDAGPLEVMFPFETCSLGLTNRTDAEVGFLIYPYSHDRFTGPERSILMPRSTLAVPVTLSRKAEPAPLEDNRLLVLMFIMKSDHDVEKLILEYKQESLGELYKDAEAMGGTTHWTTATAVLCERDPTRITSNTYGADNLAEIKYIEAHPTEPWVLAQQDEWRIVILNWQTGEIVYVDRYAASAKFVVRKKWLAIGDGSGLVTVYRFHSMERVTEFEAHNLAVTSLAVHPTRPFLISYAYNSLKIWNWNTDWSCVREFDCTSPVSQTLQE